MALSLALVFAMTVVFGASQGITAAGSAEATDKTEATEDTSAASDSEKNVSEKSALSALDDVFGEVHFYRWTRIRRNDYPTDGEWHPTLLVYDDWGYISAKAPDAIYGAPEAGAYNGVTHFFSSQHELPYKYVWNDGGKATGLDDETYFIKTNSYAQNISESDPQVQPGSEQFFTDTDRDCLYVKYGKNDSDNKGLDGKPAPVYAIKMSKSEAATQDYYLEPYSTSNGHVGMKFRDNLSYDWTFQSKGDDLFEIFNNVSWQDDPGLMVGSDNKDDRTLVRTRRGDVLNYKWFIGEEVRYSTIKGNTKVGAGQLLSIGKSRYVDAKGDTAVSTGVMLEAGQTLTIEKGGVLSIDGEFINNGTIINNGGVILVKDGGSIAPFLQGSDAATQGCGTIKCNNGDIIVMKGGAIYGGMNDSKGGQVPFYLDNSSTLINYGLVCYGSIRLGDAARVELRGDGRMYGSYYGGQLGNKLFGFGDSTKEEFEKDVAFYRQKGWYVIVNDQKTDSERYSGEVWEQKFWSFDSSLTRNTKKLMEGNETDLKSLSK